MIGGYGLQTWIWWASLGQWSVVDGILDIREHSQKVKYVWLAQTINLYRENFIVLISLSQTLPYQSECKGILMCSITQALKLSLNSLDENASCRTSHLATKDIGIVTANMRGYTINVGESDECHKKEWTIVSSTNSKCTALTSKHLNTWIYIFTLHHSGSTDDPLIHFYLQKWIYHIEPLLE